MVNKIRMTLVGLVLLLVLAACGDDNEDKASGQAKENPITSEVNDEATGSSEEEGEQEANQESDNSNLESDETIGVTMDEFIERFNNHAATNGIKPITDEYEWTDYLDTKQTALLEIHEDIDLWVMNVKGEEQLKAINLEVNGIEDRETAYATIQTLIQSIGPELTDEKTKNIMAELKLDDSTTDGDGSERFHEENGLLYMLMDDPGNSIEFGIANKNDPELQMD